MDFCFKNFHFCYCTCKDILGVFFFFTPWRNSPLLGQGHLVVEISRSPSDTQHSVGLLWTSDQPLTEKLYLTKHSTQKRQTSMPLAAFEPTIPASEQPQTHALDYAATGLKLTL